MKLDCSRLRAHLASGKFAPLYVLRGEEGFLREQALKEIRSAALDISSPGADFNLDRFDGESASAAQVVMAANLLPMMAARRLVIVRRAKRLVDEEDEARGFIEYLTDPSPKTVLVLDLESPPDGRRKAWKEIEPRVTVVQCDPLKDWELESWIRDRGSGMNLRLGREESRYLAGEFGSDLRRLLNELEKLSLYASGKPVGPGELAEILGRGKAQNIFKFTDAVASRDVATALKQLGRLMDEGEPALVILAMIDRVVAQLLVAREVLARSRRSAELMRVFRLSPRGADNLLNWAKRFEEQELLRAMHSLARADRALKTSGAPSRLLLEGVVISLCGEPSARAERAAGRSEHSPEPARSRQSAKRG